MHLEQAAEAAGLFPLLCAERFRFCFLEKC